MKSINEILKDYTAGEAELEETNAALKEAGASYHLVPGRNVLTEEDRRETSVGYYPEQANGWGLLDTGTGTMDKVHVVDGRLECAVNEILPDGQTNMTAYVTICGKLYGAVNHNSISVELCDTRKDGVYGASGETLDNAVTLCREIMERYKIPLERVVRHFDVTGKHCSAYMMDEAEWNRFKGRIAGKELDNTPSPAHKDAVEWAVA